MQSQLEEKTEQIERTPGYMAATDLLDAESAFKASRSRMFGIAYRNLRSVREAEDLVQEAWIRWQNCDRSTVRDVPAFLSTVIERLSINAGMSARARREATVTWIPDRADERTSPEVVTERGNEVELALGLILERLTPAERAAFLLREAFDYSYEEIADILQQTQVSVRQQVRRARIHLEGSRHTHVGATEHQSLSKAFMAAARTGDMRLLEELLIADVSDWKRRPSHRPAITITRITMMAIS